MREAFPGVRSQSEAGIRLPEGSSGTVYQTPAADVSGNHFTHIIVSRIDSHVVPLSVRGSRQASTVKVVATGIKGLRCCFAEGVSVRPERR